MPFALTWWSLTFPVGTFVTGTTQLAVHTGLPAFQVAAAIAYAGLLGTWGLVAVRTAGGSVRRQPVRAAAQRRADQGEEGPAGRLRLAHRVRDESKCPVLPSGRGVRRQHGATRLSSTHAPALHPGGVSQASRIAVTPWPPAAQIEIRPRTGFRPVSAFFCASCLASCATMRPPVAANG